MSPGRHHSQALSTLESGRAAGSQQRPGRAAPSSRRRRLPSGGSPQVLWETVESRGLNQVTAVGGSPRKTRSSPRLACAHLCGETTRVLRSAVRLFGHSARPPGTTAARAAVVNGGIRTYDLLHGKRVMGSVAYTSAQIGHTDPRFTLRCYTQATRRRERLSGPHLRAYDRALEWARMGTMAPDEPLLIPEEATKNPA